jgi:hypothetical protein
MALVEAELAAGNEDSAPSGFAWTDALARVHPASAVSAWLADRDDAAVGSVFPWMLAGWLEEAQDWTIAALHKTGIREKSGLRQVRSFHTGCTSVIDAEDGAYYHKAVARGFIREAVNYEALHEEIGKGMPRAIAVDADRGWLLTKEVKGPLLSEVADAPAWEAALREYGLLQRRSTPALLKRDPLPRYPPSALPTRFGAMLDRVPVLQEGHEGALSGEETAMLRKRVVDVTRLCGRDASYSLPDCLLHGDLHPDNIRVQDGVSVYLDWAWSFVSHPFLDVAAFLRRAERHPFAAQHLQGLSDSYFRAWSEEVTQDDSSELLSLMRPFGQVIDALQDAEWVASLIGTRGRHRAPRAPSYLDWALERRRYYWIHGMRKLLQSE